MPLRTSFALSSFEGRTIGSIVYDLRLEVVSFFAVRGHGHALGLLLGIDSQRDNQRGEHDHRTEANALSKGACDQRRRDDGEHGLIDHERLLRYGGGVASVRLSAYPTEEQISQIAKKGAPWSKHEAVVSFYGVE